MDSFAQYGKRCRLSLVDMSISLTFCCPSTDKARHAAGFASDCAALGRLQARQISPPEALTVVRIEAMMRMAEVLGES